MAVWILSSSVMILLVLILRTAFRRWIRPTVKYLLWLPVLLRLLIPFSVGETVLSAEHLYRELPKWEVQAGITIMTGELFTGEYAADSEPSEDSEEPLEYYQTVTDRLITKGGSDAVRFLRITWITGCAVVGTVLLVSNLHFYFCLRKTRR